MIRKRWAVVALAAAIGLVLGAASMVVAGGVAITAQANDLAVIKTLSINDTVSTSSSSFVDIPGLARTATSTGNGNLFVARLSGAGLCSSGGDAICQVRIIVKDNAGSQVAVMNPSDGALATFVYTDDDQVTSELRTVERSISGLAPGTYTFQVQLRVVVLAGTFFLDGPHLTLERYT